MQADYIYDAWILKNIFLPFLKQGTARRKKKVVHRTATTDDKKLQSSLKKLSVNNIPGIEEVSYFIKHLRCHICFI